MIAEREFGKTKNGERVLAFTLRDGDGCATVLNLGGIVQSIVVPDRDGKPTDVVCGYSDRKSTRLNSSHMA